MEKIQLYVSRLHRRCPKSGALRMLSLVLFALALLEDALTQA